MFFDRDDELGVINRLLGSDRAELIVVYGRRRVGKTTLINKAIRKYKKKLYLFVVRGSLGDILENFSLDIREQLGLPVSFSRWQDFMDFLKALSKESFVVVFDEFQRLNEASPATISKLQDVWDRYLSKSKIKLILVGSVIGMVEKLALNGTAPLYGRKTAELRIRPLPYLRVREYFDWLDSEEEKVKYFGCFGGTPAYFMLIDPSKSLEENIAHLILDKGAKLTTEPEELLSQEVRSPSTYLSILGLLARRGGGRGLTLSKIHVRKGSPTEYLLRLEKMDLIERIPILDTNKTLYRISDEFFRFWFTFIYPRLSIIERGQGRKLTKQIMRNMDHYLSVTLEKILEEIITEKSGETLGNTQLPIIDRIGVVLKKSDTDIIGIGKEAIVIGEAKWWQKPVPRIEIEKFIAKKHEIRELYNKKVIGVMLTRKGYEQKAKKLENDELVLIELDQLDKYL